MRSVVVSLLLLVILLSGGTAIASEIPEEISSQFSELEKGDYLILDAEHGIWLRQGEIRKVSGYVPFVKCDQGNEYLVSFRLFAELMGWKVFWNQGTVYAQVVEYTDMGNSTLVGRFIEFEYPSSQRFKRVLVGDRVMVPLDLLSGFLRWNHGFFDVISVVENERIVITISTLG